MKMKFSDELSLALYELQRASFPKLEVKPDLNAFAPDKLERVPNLGPAISILKRITLLEARDHIRAPAGSHEAKKFIFEKLSRVIAGELIHRELVSFEIGDYGERGYPVIARVRVMRGEE